LWDNNCISEDNEGISIESLDKYCKVKLFKNRKCFAASILQILPKKESKYEIKCKKVSLVYQYMMLNKVFPMEKYPDRFTIPI
jgi:hypothetical protein